KPKASTPITSPRRSSSAPRPRPSRAPNRSFAERLAMTHTEALDRVVREVSAQVHWRRAEHYALRGLFYGAVAGTLVLVLRGPIGQPALPIALALAVTG